MAFTKHESTRAPARDQIAVTIVDRAHPHYGEHGVMTGEIIRFRPTGEQMAKVKLDHCAHGTNACFVTKGQIAERAR